MSHSRSKSRGICNRCGQLRTLASQIRGYCKPCGYDRGHCSKCLAYRKIYVRGRCYLCYQDDLVRVRLNQMESDFVQPASQYNQYIFDLYLTYIKRYRMSYDHLKPTQDLAQYLEQTKVTPIRRWNDIYKLSRSFPLTRSPGSSVHDNGCAWMKIGYMLQELSVLGSRSDEYQHRVEALLEDMDSQTIVHVLAFARALKKSGRTDASINRLLSVLRSFNDWLSQLDPAECLLLAQTPSIECYFELSCNTQSYCSAVSIFRRLAAFYRFAKQAKLILHDPTQNIRLSRPAGRLVVCSKTQFDQLSTFLRDSNSNPEQALVITLVLFYGLTVADLAGACLDISHQTQGQLKIILSRRPRSRGRRYFNREQILEIPLDPSWLKLLSERFRLRWQTQFEKIKPKISFPKTPLYLHSRGLHNRNPSDEYIRALIKKATLNATGVPIPSRVLRQTCGHLMTRGDDASALGHLGWSPQFAFHYTWLPRILFQPKS